MTDPTMTKTVALLPCPNPWCPSQPKAESYFDDGGYFYRVRCLACGIKSPDGNSETEAVANWNTRTSTRVEQPWRTIRTAPRDGSSILLGGCWNGPSIRIGEWGDGAFLGARQGYAKDWTTGSDWGFEPTHWMPLPDDPSASAIEATQTDQQLREEVERLREAAELAKACLGAGFGDHPIEAIRGSNITRAWHYLHDALHTSVPLSPIKEGSK